MVIYQGVVHGDTVRLPADAHLPDGLVVEVRAPIDEPVDPNLQAREDAFRQHLIATGRLIPKPATPTLAEIEVIEPIEVEGTPVSELIIADRR